MVTPFINCAIANDQPLPVGYYSDLLQGKPTDAPIIEGKICSDHNLSKSIFYTSFTVKRKLEVFNLQLANILALGIRPLFNQSDHLGYFNCC